jgi:hypothetical protein
MLRQPLLDSLLFSLYLQLMEAIQISGIFKNAICRAQPIEPDLYRITMDTVFIGKILRESGGWQLQEVAGEELTAENVQLIGSFLDKKRR